MDTLNQQIMACRRCPRLIEHCARIAREKRASFRSHEYHGGPVPNFGDPDARLLIVGLAPAAHGANRTGRMFTGDRSGDWLFRAMHEAGFCNQPEATSIDDGLTLNDAMITASAHCAPPGNKPTSDELANCAAWLDLTIANLANLRAMMCLGRLGFNAALGHYQRQDVVKKRSAYSFAHGAEHQLPNGMILLCSYHPSQQNTFTGRLTREMFDQVFTRARILCDSS